MQVYEVIFKKQNKTHKVRVDSQGLVPAIDVAIQKHFFKYVDALSFEIIEARKVVE